MPSKPASKVQGLSPDLVPTQAQAASVERAVAASVEQVIARSAPADVPSAAAAPEAGGAAEEQAHGAEDFEMWVAVSAWHKQNSCEVEGCTETFYLFGRHHCRRCGTSVCSVHFRRPLCIVCAEVSEA